MTIDAARFFRKPDFQLRDLGAPAPAVSFSLNPTSSRSRQPTTVVKAKAVDASSLGAGSAIVATGAGSTLMDGTDSVATVFGLEFSTAGREAAGALDALSGTGLFVSDRDTSGITHSA